MRRILKVLISIFLFPTQFIKAILAMPLLFALLFSIQKCEDKIINAGKVTSGDFIIEIKEDNKDVNEKYIRIMGLSEEGKTKEIIVVPQYIDDMEVRALGTGIYAQGFWESEVLKKVYIVFVPRKIGNVFPIDQVYILTDMIPDYCDIDPDYYITSYYHDESSSSTLVPFKYGAGDSCRFATLSYMYNYEDSPNKDYYWIDNVQYGSLITYIPDNPTREGYTFDGWYKEKECLNKWDFENDKVHEELRDKDPQFFFKETILYAKWVEE